MRRPGNRIERAPSDNGGAPSQPGPRIRGHRARGPSQARPAVFARRPTARVHPDPVVSQFGLRPPLTLPKHRPKLGGMQKRKMPRDPNQRAAATVRMIDAILGDAELAPAPEPAKDPERVARGKLGGAKGGKLRAERLTPERRQEIARRAAVARWAHVDNGS